MLERLVLAAALVFPQVAARFEVASIRPRPDQPDRGIATGSRFGRSLIRLDYVSLQDCIALAYRVNRDRVVGPDWLSTTRFDIAATLAPGATREQVPEMMHALLAERFHLRMHRETRESAGFALRTGPETKLESATPEPDAADEPITTTLQGSGAGIFVRMPGGGSYALERDRFDARKVTMATFADLLSLFIGRPVVDATGLDGHFNISFEMPQTRILTVRYGASVGVPVPPDALQFANDVVPDAVAMSLRRAGFSLESRRLRREVIVVDTIDRSPTEN